MLKIILTTIIIFTPLTHKIGFKDYQDFYPRLTKGIYNEAIKNCNRFGIESRVYFSLLYTESRFNKNVVSCAGARGVGQVMPIHSKTPEKLFDVAHNIETSARVFKRAINKAGCIEIALLFYHAGENRKPHKYKYWWSYVYKILDRAKVSIVL